MANEFNVLKVNANARSYSHFELELLLKHTDNIDF